MRNSPAPSAHLGTAQLARALRSGIHRVIREQEKLNEINVFPVADGDTGTNLSMSLGAALDLLSRPENDHLGSFLAALADVLLDSARGNSGAIIAQFFQGMSDASADLARFDARSLTRAVATGSRYAHDALADPREGTILSVIAEFARGLGRHQSGEKAASMTEMLRTATGAARDALCRTTDQLEALRKADVVDAGAMGFVALIEGVAEYIADGEFTPEPDLSMTFTGTATSTAGAEESLSFRFCTECIVTGDEIDRRKLREELSAMGDSLVLAGTKRKAKIHIHVDDPDQVFEVAGRFGDLAGIKADDMQRQQHSTHGASARFAVITDSAADIPDEDLERLDIHIVPCRIQFGGRGYLDKVSITTDEFFRELARNPVAPTTSQPSPGDFRRQFQYLASHFPDVISINLTPTVSGTLQAAQSAASRTNASGRVHVVNSQNASLGQGQLAIFAAECAASGLDVDTTLSALTEMIALTTSFALVRDLSYAVRGGRVPASKKAIADWLALTPVIRTRADGSVAARGLLPGRRNLLVKFARYVARHCNRDAELNLAVGHAVCEEDAVELRKLLLDLLPRVRSSPLTGIGAALGAHGGPGSLVVAVQEYRDPNSFR